MMNGSGLSPRGGGAEATSAAGYDEDVISRRARWRSESRMWYIRGGGRVLSTIGIGMITETGSLSQPKRQSAGDLQNDTPPSGRDGEGRGGGGGGGGARCEGGRLDMSVLIPKKSPQLRRNDESARWQMDGFITLAEFPNCRDMGDLRTTRSDAGEIPVGGGWNSKQRLGWAANGLWGNCEKSAKWPYRSHRSYFGIFTCSGTTQNVGAWHLAWICARNMH